MEIGTKPLANDSKKYNENKVEYLRRDNKKHDPNEWPKGKFVFGD